MMSCKAFYMSEYMSTVKRWVKVEKHIEINNQLVKREAVKFIIQPMLSELTQKYQPE